VASGDGDGWSLTGRKIFSTGAEGLRWIVGNNGLTRHNPLERHLRDVLCARVPTPQDDSIVDAAGRAAFTGL
jgi:alkylation response protein AidB-like acyl-CoA dehydrogenase